MLRCAVANQVKRVFCCDREYAHVVGHVVGGVERLAVRPQNRPAHRPLVVWIGRTFKRQGGRLWIDREHPNRAAPKIGYHDAATIGSPRKPNCPTQPTRPARRKRRSRSFLQAAIALHCEAANAAIGLKAGCNGKNRAGRVELNLGWTFSKRELDGRARNRGQAASFIETKPCDVRYASGICERHSLVCHVDDITMDGEAHW